MSVTARTTTVNGPPLENEARMDCRGGAPRPFSISTPECIVLSLRDQGVPGTARERGPWGHPAFRTHPINLAPGGAEGQHDLAPRPRTVPPAGAGRGPRGHAPGGFAAPEGIARRP